MNTIHNPTRRGIHIPVLNGTVWAGQTVEVTREQALALEHSSILVVHVDEPPKRKYTPRGSKIAETTSAPAVETRNGDADE
jgi:hypothetical protein